MGSGSVAQAGLNPPTSASGVSGTTCMRHDTQLRLNLYSIHNWRSCECEVSHTDDQLFWHSLSGPPPTHSGGPCHFLITYLISIELCICFWDFFLNALVNLYPWSLPMDSITWSHLQSENIKWKIPEINDLPVLYCMPF
jgi:hypothetical protein